MASPPSQKRQKLSASATSPSTLPPEPAAVQSPVPPSPATAATTLSTLPPSPPNPRKRRASQNLESDLAGPPTRPSGPGEGSSSAAPTAIPSTAGPAQPAPEEGVKKKGRTNTPWTAAEEQLLKQMRDAGKSWGEIARAFPSRTEGSVKKHWYKDMHYAEFAPDEEVALREAIREYDANKWKVIGQKVGKPAKACEQHAKEHKYI